MSENSASSRGSPPSDGGATGNRRRTSRSTVPRQSSGSRGRSGTEASLLPRWGTQKTQGNRRQQDLPAAAPAVRRSTRSTRASQRSGSSADDLQDTREAVEALLLLPSAIRDPMPQHDSLRNHPTGLRSTPPRQRSAPDPLVMSRDTEPQEDLRVINRISSDPEAAQRHGSPSYPEAAVRDLAVSAREELISDVPVRRQLQHNRGTTPQLTVAEIRPNTAAAAAGQDPAFPTTTPTMTPTPPPTVSAPRPTTTGVAVSLAAGRSAAPSQGPVPASVTLPTMPTLPSLASWSYPPAPVVVAGPAPNTSVSLPDAIYEPKQQNPFRKVPWEIIELMKGDGDDHGPTLASIAQLNAWIHSWESVLSLQQVAASGTDVTSHLRQAREAVSLYRTAATVVPRHQSTTAEDRQQWWLMGIMLWASPCPTSWQPGAGEASLANEDKWIRAALRLGGVDPALATHDTFRQIAAVQLQNENPTIISTVANMRATMKATHSYDTQLAQSIMGNMAHFTSEQVYNGNKVRPFEYVLPHIAYWKSEYVLPAQALDRLKIQLRALNGHRPNIEKRATQGGVNQTSVTSREKAKGHLQKLNTVVGQYKAAIADVESKIAGSDPANQAANAANAANNAANQPGPNVLQRPQEATSFRAAAPAAAGSSRQQVALVSESPRATLRSTSGVLADTREERLSRLYDRNGERPFHLVPTLISEIRNSRAGLDAQRSEFISMLGKLKDIKLELERAKRSRGSGAMIPMHVKETTHLRQLDEAWELVREARVQTATSPGPLWAPTLVPTMQDSGVEPRPTLQANRLPEPARPAAPARAAASPGPVLPGLARTAAPAQATALPAHLSQDFRIQMDLPNPFAMIPNWIAHIQQSPLTPTELARKISLLLSKLGALVQRVKTRDDQLRRKGEARLTLREKEILQHPRMLNQAISLLQRALAEAQPLGALPSSAPHGPAINVPADNSGLIIDMNRPDPFRSLSAFIRIAECSSGSIENKSEAFGRQMMRIERLRPSLMEKAGPITTPETQLSTVQKAHRVQLVHLDNALLLLDRALGRIGASNSPYRRQAAQMWQAAQMQQAAQMPLLPGQAGAAVFTPPGVFRSLQPVPGQPLFNQPLYRQEQPQPRLGSLTSAPSQAGAATVAPLGAVGSLCSRLPWGIHILSNSQGERLSLNLRLSDDNPYACVPAFIQLIRRRPDDAAKMGRVLIVVMRRIETHRRHFEPSAGSTMSEAISPEQRKKQAQMEHLDHALALLEAARDELFSRLPSNPPPSSTPSRPGSAASVASAADPPRVEPLSNLVVEAMIKLNSDEKDPDPFKFIPSMISKINRSPVEAGDKVNTLEGLVHRVMSKRAALNAEAGGPGRTASSLAQKNARQKLHLLDCAVLSLQNAILELDGIVVVSDTETTAKRGRGGAAAGAAGGAGGAATGRRTASPTPLSRLAAAWRDDGNDEASPMDITMDNTMIQDTGPLPDTGQMSSLSISQSDSPRTRDLMEL